MNKGIVTAIFCLAFITLFEAHSLAKDFWAFTASGKLDARITRQLNELAAQNGAEISRVRSAGQATRRRAKLLIELRLGKKPESFLGALERETNASAAQLTPELARQGYLIENSYQHSSTPSRIRITAATAAGFHNALLRIPDFLRIWPSNLSTDLLPPAKTVRLEKNNTQVVLGDYPSFPERGIVEGFYGKPWSHHNRLEILRFEGQHGMNIYYYAPKDDPYHRKLWREPYPPAQMKNLRELVETARGNFVDFCFAISPGLSMIYSSDQDFARLMKKLASVARLGVSCFALFLDDVPQDLQHPEDQPRFKTLAAAHVDLVNKLYRQLKLRSPTNRLVVTPTVYTNEWGSRDYIRELGEGTNPNVDIVWTGPQVVSPAITVSQAKEWGALLHRPPLVWDNFPVNDGIPWRLNLGPLRGRDPNLPVAAGGLFSNPMNQARASLIPLQTVADYLWNSLDYDPARSHQKAIADQYGKDAAEPLGPFLKIYGDYWWEENVFRPLFVAERRAVDLREIEQQLGRLDSSLESLGKVSRFQELLADLSPFPSRTRERLAQVRADPAFRQLPDQKLQWREDEDVLYAVHVADTPKLDGDFAKWRAGPLYELNRSPQVFRGLKLWKGPEFFSARVALAWDENSFYVGVDVTDPAIYQPFTGRGIEKGDAILVTLETAFRRNFLRTQADGDEYRLFFSPGNFVGVGPSIFSDEDYLPPRAQPHDYSHEIKMAWKKTDRGFSGDIAIPVSFFDGGVFREGYEIGLSFSTQKVLPPPKPDAEDVERITFTSKADPLFPVSFGNPSSYQRLVLVDPRKP